MKLYKPSNKLYLILMTISLIIIGSSLYDSIDSRAFIIKTGLGCGCFASVAVAWMVDYSSCRIMERRNALHMQNLFNAFDVSMYYNLQNILRYYYKHRSTVVDNKRKYNCKELYQLLQEEDGNDKSWEECYHNIGVEVQSIDINALLAFNPVSKHSQLYTIIKQMQEEHRTYSYIMDHYIITKTPGCSLAFLYLSNDLLHLYDLYAIRNINLSVDLDTIPYEWYKENVN